MRLPACCLAICLAVAPFVVQAQVPKDLYQVRESVAGQTTEERADALQRALRTLVLRLGGDLKQLQSAELKGVGEDPQQLVRQFTYEGQDLVVDFEPALTENKLRQAGMSLWGANRPVLMTWWFDQSAAHLLGDGQVASQVLHKAAQHRGLPLRLPLSDLSEQMFASADSLRPAQAKALQQASERYQADALLSVVAKETEAHWYLWLGEDVAQGRVEGTTSEALADAVLLAVSQSLAPRYVVKPGLAETLIVQVSGLNLRRLAELEQALEAFSPRLQQVHGDVQWWQVQANTQQLSSQLSLLGLQVVSDNEGGLDVPARLAGAEHLRFAWH